MKSAPDKAKPLREITDTSQQTAVWRPLLTGADAERMNAVADEIAVAVADTPPPRVDSSLSNGDAGLAVFYAERHRITGNRDDRRRAESYLDAAFTHVAESIPRPALFGGLAGIGLAGHLVQEHLPGETDEDLVADLDDLLVGYVAGDPAPGDYDLVNGIVGLGCYFLARLPRSAAEQGIEAIVDRLAETAEPDAGGTTWFTPPSVMGPDTLKSSPQGHHNVGLAHGVPGVISLLAEIVSAGIAVDRARDLLDRAVEWVLSCETLEGGLRFPGWIDAAGGRPRSTRLAWCYGDLGIAAALLNAARRTAREDVAGQALRIARRMADLEPEMSRVQDAGLCHGAVGVAHVFNRLYQASGDEVLADAARRWLGRALDMRIADAPLAGFRGYYPGVYPEQPWRDEPGLLTGAAGIALGLHAATGNSEPVWDRHLLIAIPPSKPQLSVPGAAGESS